ncbi:AraC family transcriptional regulator [Falsigemmobacter intermedius]|uniref:AraC family transcriptional regulator n=1 Tax=Falsigemmobacter intermedius TaxID=1553448 RepID=UPI003F0B1B0C
MYPVRVTTLEQQPMLLMPWTGPYSEVEKGFEKLEEILAAAQVFAPEVEAIVGFYHDDPGTTPPEDQRADLGVLMSEVMAAPEGMTPSDLKPGRYAVLTHKGGFNSLMKAWCWLYDEWIPGSGEQIDDSRKPFELYADSLEPGVQPDDAEILICVPVLG